jgi:hypothetical protein
MRNVRRWIADTFGFYDPPTDCITTTRAEWDYRDERLKALEALRMRVQDTLSRGKPENVKTDYQALERALHDVQRVVRR